MYVANVLVSNTYVPKVYVAKLCPVLFVLLFELSVGAADLLRTERSGINRLPSVLHILAFLQRRGSESN